MRRVKLSRREKAIENALVGGEYFDVDPSEFKEIAQSIALRRKDAVLNIRVNNRDLENLKRKARKLGIRYQTFISEFLHRIAHS